jgi:hypothetical protein
MFHTVSPLLKSIANHIGAHMTVNNYHATGKNVPEVLVKSTCKWTRAKLNISSPKQVRILR